MQDVERIARISSGLATPFGDDGQVSVESLEAYLAQEMTDFMKEDPIARSPIVAGASGFKCILPSGGFPRLINPDSESIITPI